MSSTLAQTHGLTVTVGGITVTNQVFAAVTNESAQFTSDPADGVFGLGFPALSRLGGVRTLYVMFTYSR